MELLETMVEGLAGGAGWAIGVAAALIYGPEVATGLRPIARRVVSSYHTVAEKVKTGLSEQMESLQDLYAEARMEHDGEMVTAKPAEKKPVVRRARRPRVASTRRNGAAAAAATTKAPARRARKKTTATRRASGQAPRSRPRRAAAAETPEQPTEE
ncbi:MAG: hypothetical protein ACYCW6_16795 [Candidatus Xenobia bacterium]